MKEKAPLGARIMLRDTLDWESLTDDQVIAARRKVNRIRSSRAARIITGLPDRRAGIEERTIALPGRRLKLRVHRPKNAGPRLPLILSFHGGGFIVGVPAQNDWLNSHLAAHCPAVVVSVDYRLAPEHPLPEPIEDGYDTLARILEDPAGWGVDPAAVAVLGESAGGTLAALVALRAREDGPPLHAQVLAYPGTDWSDTMADYPSIAANAGNPGFSLSEWRGGTEYGGAVAPLRVGFRRRGDPAGDRRRRGSGAAAGGRRAGPRLGHPGRRRSARDRRPGAAPAGLLRLPGRPPAARWTR
ncbi:alpha/beta hydrolase [Streptosporangium sandarakinum]|uniref:alpha/beta hydrolase n=1 Tax=Streptosporangium sandarakinum TaxID=1260955 RepID=UPI003711B887